MQELVSPRLRFTHLPQAMLKGQADPVADRQALDVLADLDHLPEVLVPERAARLEVGPPLVHVQVRAADVRRGDPDDRVGRALDARIVDVGDGHVARPVVDDCLHIPPPGIEWSLVYVDRLAPPPSGSAPRRGVGTGRQSSSPSLEPVASVNDKMRVVADVRA